MVIKQIKRPLPEHIILISRTEISKKEVPPSPSSDPTTPPLANEIRWIQMGSPGPKTLNLPIGGKENSVVLDETWVFIISMLNHIVI